MLTLAIYLLIQLLEDLQEKQKVEEKLQQELEALKESSTVEKQNLAKITAECDRLRSSCDEKESALQVVILISPRHLQFYLSL